MKQLIVTAVGPDRPGLVGELTANLHLAGANLADSRMVNLRGQFALLLLLEAEPEVLARLRESLPAHCRVLGLTATLSEVDAPSTTVRGVPYRLRTYSADQPGIVARVTEVLRRHSANIEELTTRLDSAPFEGSPLFTLNARLTLPQGVPLRALRAELETVCDALNCDIDLDPA